MKPILKPLVISAPFGNWISHPGATSTLGTYTLQNRAGKFRWWMIWKILKTLRRHRALGAWTNSLGLPSPGISNLIATCERIEAEEGKKHCSDKILSIHGFDELEWELLLANVVNSGIAPLALELNVSCVEGNARIMTANGLLRIEDLARGPADVLTEYGVARSDGAQLQGQKNVLRITTHTGNRLLVTPDHKFKVLVEDGSVEWRLADDIRKGDHLLCRKGHGGLLPKSRGESPDYWYLLGLLYGDGHRYEHGPLAWNIAESKAALIERIETSLRDMGTSFSTKTRAASNRNGVNRRESETTIIASASSPLRAALPPWAPNGGWRKSGVPKELWTQGEEQIAAFLGGLFDTDGGIGRQGSTIVFTTSRRRLATDVKALLLLFGVVSTIDTKKKREVSESSPFKGSGRAFTIRTIGPKSLKAFKHLIGFFVPQKAKALELAIEKSDRRLRDRLLGYPYAAEIIRRCSPEGSWRGGTALADSTAATLRGLRSGRTSFLSEAKMPAVIERLELLEEGDCAQPLRDYVDNDWWFDEVRSVRSREGTIPVYDVIGSATESYVSSGIVSHNCPNVGHVSVPPKLLERAVMTEIPVIVKLPPVRWRTMFDMARAAGVEAFHACNTLPTPAGGMSGKPLKNVSLDVVKTIKDIDANLLVIGGGGITNGGDVADYVNAGSDKVAVGSALLENPFRPWRRRALLELLAGCAHLRTST